jgi:hypothetical protein
MLLRSEHSAFGQARDRCGTASGRDPRWHKAIAPDGAPTKD